MGANVQLWVIVRKKVRKHVLSVSVKCMGANEICLMVLLSEVDQNTVFDWSENGECSAYQILINSNFDVF